VDALLQRVTGLATCFTPPTKRLDRAGLAQTVTRAPRWAVSGVFWLVLLLLPGSFLLLPALLWWRARRVP
jgi:hypothetical protein